MKSVVCEAHGGSDALKLRDMPVPRPAPDQILVRVRAAGVNPAECKLRRGAAPSVMLPRLPWIPGFDVAGDVEAVGSAVTRFEPGDAVFGLLALNRAGGYAELAVLEEQSAAIKPAALSYEEAASIPVSGSTALQALRDVGGLGAGGSVAINGAAGGVGTFAVQIARALGATVTGTCGRGSAELVRSLGAAEVVDHVSLDFTTRGQVYDVVLDAVATRSFRQCARALKPRGRYVTTVPDLALLLQMALLPLTALVGYRRRPRFVLARGKAADLDLLGRFTEEGELRPVIDRVLPIEDVRAAHDYVEAGHAHGKVVLRVA